MSSYWLTAMVFLPLLGAGFVTLQSEERAAWLFLVPSLILQPLLENAMRHGVSAADGRCRLTLTVRTRNDRLLIDVRDAGPGFDLSKADGASGVGLRNTAERLSYLYGDDHRFDLQGLEGGGLLVAIDLPLKRQ